MNADRLLTLYERIADAPDAVARLRHLIINLAVHGRLVPQHPSDVPVFASNSAHIRQPGLPANWGCIPLASLLEEDTRNGYSRRPDDAPDGTPILRISAGTTRRDGVVAEEEHKLISGIDSDVRMQYGLKAGDVLACRFNGNKAFVGRLTIFTDYLSIRPIYPDKLIRVRISDRVAIPSFVRMAGDADFVRHEIEAACATTVGNWGISASNLKQICFPLPPLAEQYRIVAKVEELMTLCDRLEAARAERETNRDRLTAASLARLNMPDPETFEDDARFALNVLPALTTRPDQIKQLRQAVLNLAVRGGLSPKKVWPSSPVELGSVASLQNGYAFKSEWFAKSGIRLVRNANVGHRTLDWSEEVRLPDNRLKEFQRFQLRDGDVVLSLDRPFIVTGTKVARVRGADLPALLLQRVGRFLLSEVLAPEYIFVWINSPLFTEQIDPGRSNGVPHISSKQVEAAALFVPPLAEQHRIVAKVGELMAFCDRLEASLTSGDETRRRLLDALLTEALTPAETLEQTPLHEVMVNDAA